MVKYFMKHICRSGAQVRCPRPRHALMKYRKKPGHLIESILLPSIKLDKRMYTTTIIILCRISQMMISGPFSLLLVP